MAHPHAHSAGRMRPPDRTAALLARHRDAIAEADRATPEELDAYRRASWPQLVGGLVNGRVQVLDPETGDPVLCTTWGDIAVLGTVADQMQRRAGAR